uniref:Uncharacterized protein n=1 Tax=Ixodes ricinus TaxID=34613 RepID=A0A6B0U7Y6_IXORI
MFLASSSTMPSAPVLLTFSLPARSTKYSFPLSFFWSSRFSCLTLIRNTLWLLELCSFMFVTAMCLLDFPSSMTSITSSGLVTNLSVAPLTKGTLFLSS